jgi:hypothetical protein
MATETKLRFHFKESVILWSSRRIYYLRSQLITRRTQKNFPESEKSTA